MAHYSPDTDASLPAVVTAMPYFDTTREINPPFVCECFDAATDERVPAVFRWNPRLRECGRHPVDDKDVIVPEGWAIHERRDLVFVYLGPWIDLVHFASNEWN